MKPVNYLIQALRLCSRFLFPLPEPFFFAFPCAWVVRTRRPILNTARLDFRDYLFNTVLRDNQAELVPQFVSCVVWATPNVNELAVIARRFVCRVFEITMKPIEHVFLLALSP